MEAFGVGNQTYEIIDIDDQSLSIFKWKDWELNLLLISLTISEMICISGQAMIIIYIQRYAKKDRPINTMIWVDQVFHLFKIYLRNDLATILVLDVPT